MYLQRTLRAQKAFGGASQARVVVWQHASGEIGRRCEVKLVREAGGLVTDFSGNNDPLYKGEIVAGSVKVVQGLVKHLK